jgi:hypothetical protein
MASANAPEAMGSTATRRGRHRHSERSFLCALWRTTEYENGLGWLQATFWLLL